MTAFRQAAARLARAGVADPTGDARRLLRHFCGTDDPDQATDLAPFLQAVDQRARRQPVSQIIGRRAFWNAEFEVTPDTLDPRPETELLVEHAVAAKPTRVLELGVGTGAVLLSILAEVPGAMGTGTDISAAALAVAGRNAARLGLSDRVSLHHSDWFATVSGRFDIVVSNPPYIPAADMARLEPEVRDWEPRLALSPGGDGLASYRAIAAGLADHLVPDGCGLFEFGAGQADDVAAIFAAAGFECRAIYADLSGHLRVIAVGGSVDGMK